MGKPNGNGSFHPSYQSVAKGKGSFSPKVVFRLLFFINYQNIELESFDICWWNITPGASAFHPIIYDSRSCEIERKYEANTSCVRCDIWEGKGWLWHCLQHSTGPTAHCTGYHGGFLGRNLRQVLPDVQLRGCAFHFMQVIWRKIQKPLSRVARRPALCRSVRLLSRSPSIRGQLKKYFDLHIL